MKLPLQKKSRLRGECLVIVCDRGITLSNRNDAESLGLGHLGDLMRKSTTVCKRSFKESSPVLLRLLQVFGCEDVKAPLR